jgi:hypothetical protein
MLQPLRRGPGGRKIVIFRHATKSVVRVTRAFLKFFSGVLARCRQKSKTLSKGDGASGVNHCGGTNRTYATEPGMGDVSCSGGYMEEDDDKKAENEPPLEQASFEMNDSESEVAHNAIRDSVLISMEGMQTFFLRDSANLASD